MAPKRNAATGASLNSAVPASPAKNPPVTKSTSSSSSSSKASIKNAQDAQQILQGVYNNYVDNTPQRVKLIDTFMVFLMLVGALQFVYCVIAGNYVS